ncbi:MAG: D-aminoacyl-tRNA deacylase [Rubricoccaceae bacterium]|nr:D-aminoacyl-tRNA deacylase [Rubricoccaceae bacterium]
MIALVQRVKEASVTVDGKMVGAIGPGLLLLLGVHTDDTDAEADWLAGKVSRLRVFKDPEGKMNYSLLDTGGEALVVSQFTLYGDARKGNRPSYINAAAPEKAESLYVHFAKTLSGLLQKPVPTGVFGAMMDVHLVNDGPVTLWIEKSPNGEKAASA